MSHLVCIHYIRVHSQVCPSGFIWTRTSFTHPCPRYKPSLKWGYEWTSSGKPKTMHSVMFWRNVSHDAWCITLDVDVMKKIIFEFSAISQHVAGNWNTFFVNGKDLFIIHSLYCRCWWHGDACSQGTSSHDIDPLLLEYPVQLSRVNTILVISSGTPYLDIIQQSLDCYERHQDNDIFL